MQDTVIEDSTFCALTLFISRLSLSYTVSIYILSRYFRKKHYVLPVYLYLDKTKIWPNFRRYINYSAIKYKAFLVFVRAGHYCQ